MPSQMATLELRPSQQSVTKPFRWVNGDGGGINGSGVHFPFAPPAAPGGNSLTYFTVTGFWYDIEQPNPNSTLITPLLLNVNAYVDFIPRLPVGFSVFVSNLNHGDGTFGDTDVPIAPITGRLINGALTTIAVGDPLGVGLLANSPVLNLASQLAAIGWSTTGLIYDVRFRNVTFGGANQVLSNFAFFAPPNAATISISSSLLQKLPYGGP
jgi:hypothetical protein